MSRTALVGATIASDNLSKGDPAEMAAGVDR
jgi:hypothetical protein